MTSGALAGAAAHRRGRRPRRADLALPGGRCPGGAVDAGIRRMLDRIEDSYTLTATGSRTLLARGAGPSLVRDAWYAPRCGYGGPALRPGASFSLPPVLGRLTAVMMGHAPVARRLRRADAVGDPSMSSYETAGYEPGRRFGGPATSPLASDPRGARQESVPLGVSLATLTALGVFHIAEVALGAPLGRGELVTGHNPGPIPRR